MKKIFALILMSITVCVNANAKWYKEYFKADELLEQDAYYANVYDCSIGRFICLSNEIFNVGVECKRGMFDTKENYVYGVRIGLYKGNKLIEVIKDVRCWCVNGSNNQIVTIGGSDCYVNGEFTYETLGLKIIQHLKYVGKVRIIVPKYIGSDFDITIPMNPNIKSFIWKPKPIVEKVSESTDTIKTVKIEMPKTYPIAIENTYKMELPKICPITIESTYKDIISSYRDYDYYNTSDYK